MLATEIELLQKAFDTHKKETNQRCNRLEDAVREAVEKIHGVAVDMAGIATSLSVIPNDRHLEEHDYIRSDMEASKRKAEFFHALTLSLASKFGWKLLIVLSLMLLGYVWHSDDIKTWVFEEFLKKEVVEVVK